MSQDAFHLIYFLSGALLGSCFAILALAVRGARALSQQYRAEEILRENRHNASKSVPEGFKYGLGGVAGEGQRTANDGDNK